MNKKLFKIDDSERQRILEMHQGATKKQYLGEDVTTTQTTTPPATTKVTTPSIAPAPISKLTIQNTELQLFKNGKPVTLYVYVRPELKNNQPVTGSYIIEVSNSKEIPNLVYKFTYNCSNPDVVTQVSNLATVPEESQLNGITANYGDKTYENKIKTYTSGFEQKSYNELRNLLSQARGGTIKWDISNFQNLPKC